VPGRPTAYSDAPGPAMPKGGVNVTGDKPTLVTVTVEINPLLRVTPPKSSADGAAASDDAPEPMRSASERGRIW